MKIDSERGQGAVWAVQPVGREREFKTRKGEGYHGT